MFHVFRDKFRNRLLDRDAIFLLLLVVIGAIVLLTFGRQAPFTSASSFCKPVGINYGTDTFDIYAPENGSYLVWLHVETPMQIDFNDLPDVYNPLLVAVDNKQCYTVGKNSVLPLNYWAWVDQLNTQPLQRFRVNLTRGLHAFTVTGSYISIDRVELIRNTCEPVQNGSNCANQNNGPAISASNSS